MPRPNPPRALGSESELRRRIAYEREQRGWSPAGLASRMTKAGCPIQQSAIWKIENADRRITVDEHVALSKVFETSMVDLLVSPEIAADKRARKLAEEYKDALETASEAWFRLAVHVADHPQVASLFDEYVEPGGKFFGVRFTLDKWKKNRAASTLSDEERAANWEAAWAKVKAANDE